MVETTVTTWPKALVGEAALAAAERAWHHVFATLTLDPSLVPPAEELHWGLIPLASAANRVQAGAGGAAMGEVDAIENPPVNPMNGGGDRPYDAVQHELVAHATCSGAVPRPLAWRRPPTRLTICS